MVEQQWQSLVDDRREWIAHNFPDSDPLDTVIGVVEEMGELAHAHLKQKQRIRGLHEELTLKGKDAVGDLAVYLLGVMEIVGQCPSSASEVEPHITLDQALLKLAHAVGNIAIRQSLYDLEQVVGLLDRYCRLRGWDMDVIVSQTWAKVRKRDWIKDPLAGGGHV